MPSFVIVVESGKVPVRKGPFDTEAMKDALLELYALKTECSCVVIDMPATSYPQSGKEWLFMHDEVTPNSLDQR